ncbi:hypothetical protein A2U01_0052996, partial [Trifolium medium]|nr:hypothetical protein [Trifolium medium]
MLQIRCNRPPFFLVSILPVVLTVLDLRFLVPCFATRNSKARETTTSTHKKVVDQLLASGTKPEAIKEIKKGRNPDIIKFSSDKFGTGTVDLGVVSLIMFNCPTTP